MKAKVIFTKKDVLVTIGCVLFLLANLGAIGSGGRRRAKEAICLSNLRQWGIIFQTFTNDNNGYFHPGYAGGIHGQGQLQYAWPWALREYHKHDYNLWLCPEASKPVMDENQNSTGSRHPNAAWGINASVPGH